MNPTPLTDRLATCRAAECRAPIRWRQNVVTGKRLPLDADPVASDVRLVSAPRHHYRILDAETCRRCTADEWNDHTVPLFISHFRTCRRRDLWSQTRQDRPGRAEVRS